MEVFVGASPAFAKLRSRALRRTLAKLVTVEQAARVAGVDADALVERLNAALAGTGSSGAPLPRAGQQADPPPLPASLLAIDAARIADLDVRDELRAGREPFRGIMDAARALPVGHVLRVRAIFEPAPLYAVLGKLGFTHAAERLGDEDWRVWFLREARAGAAPAEPEGAVEDEVVVLDVRGLEPPEPLVKTLEALAVLPRGKTLVQLNVRVPRLLLPKLDERGFVYEIREQSPALTRVFIRHREP